MEEKYKAMIHGDTIEWGGERPDGILNDEGLHVEITVVSDKKILPKSDGPKMAAALAGIAARGGVRSIPDPVAWQREIRKDRPLPGRDQ